MTVDTLPVPVAQTGSEPVRRSAVEQAGVYAFVIGPFLALLAALTLAVPAHAITPLVAILAVAGYAITALGITAGFHRLFTHQAYRAAPWLRAGLALAGSMAVQGPVIRWVADHRRHHRYADQPGDPHSPWRFGTSPWQLAKGMGWSHLGWLFDRKLTPVDTYAPDLLRDPVLVRINTAFPALVALSVLGPPALALALTGSWTQTWQALLWASLVRIFLLHHVTWSINSLCHMLGTKPYRTADHSTNLWPLAIVSLGESWHNYHHADPSSARHGVGARQIDLTAGFIRLAERVGAARHVRWPTPARITSRRTDRPTRTYRWVVRLGRLMLRALRAARTVHGAPNVPVAGPGIVAISHFGYLDFMMAQWALWHSERRYVRFLATAAAFRHRLSGPLMRAMRHIPVDRTAGAHAYAAARAALREGDLVGIFPEGRVSASFTLLAFKTGAARLALETGAPLIPCVVWGAHRIRTRTRTIGLRKACGIPVTIAFGTPLTPLPAEDAHSLTQRLRATMTDLLNDAISRYPQPAGAWWLPAQYGGSAPAPTMPS